MCRIRDAVKLAPLVVVLLVASCGSAPAADPPVGAQGAEAVVTRVTDGDTVHIYSAAGPDVVRLLGIDTPETVKPHTPVQCGGPEASAFAHQLLDGQHVTIVADPTQADRDRYHRLLRYVRLSDGRDYSVEAARAGMARDYVYGYRPVQEQAQIMGAQGEAQAARRGLWGEC